MAHDHRDHPAWDDVQECLALHDTPAMFICELEGYGWQITRIPERKARPDAPGWWWICDEDDATGMYEVVRTGPGALIALGVRFSFNVASRSIRWAVGPIEPPEGGE